MSSDSSGGGGIGILGVIGIVFVVLKILEVAPVVSWSWVWVLSPFWIGLLLALLGWVLILVGSNLGSFFDIFTRGRSVRLPPEE